jgi:hypothetical protein
MVYELFDVTAMILIPLCCFVVLYIDFLTVIFCISGRGLYILDCASPYHDDACMFLF